MVDAKRYVLIKLGKTQTCPECGHVGARPYATNKCGEEVDVWECDSCENTWPRDAEVQMPSSARIPKPIRVQRKRTQGWKMPLNTVYVGRPTKWGNDYQVGEWSHEDPPRQVTRNDAKDLFRIYQVPMMVFDHIDFKELRGKNLACWCPLNQPCHADVLLELANA